MIKSLQVQERACNVSYLPFVLVSEAQLAVCSWLVADFHHVDKVRSSVLEIVHLYLLV